MLQAEVAGLQVSLVRPVVQARVRLLLSLAGPGQQEGRPVREVQLILLTPPQLDWQLEGGAGLAWLGAERLRAAVQATLARKLVYPARVSLLAATPTPLPRPAGLLLVSLPATASLPATDLLSGDEFYCLLRLGSLLRRTKVESGPGVAWPGLVIFPAELPTGLQALLYDLDIAVQCTFYTIVGVVSC